ncbi:putative serine/threonine protein kinase [Blattamonas nauphoetae]|uniref:non-specific serine/threonine protein kinase n=1 Tax=Blattamonas nauphoetae TaxID=2049346 RepID=A0ABQ9XV97_9EUKA|nr:putative serine/threonine protein kinase [Blattamonas nauphoetae]
MLKEGDKERVSREVEMLIRFAHPRIVRLHESIDMGGHQAIVMELGTRSLKDLISEYEERKELIPLPLTVMILIDICSGLLWMHTHSSGSTAHGDLKPENVLLRPNNRAFLCDLGGSAPLDQQMTSTIGELGTFEYNSPERAMDSKGTATPASDIWSLGVVAYRMVTGRPLFEGLHLLQMTVALHTFNESRIPLSINQSVRDVLLKMLEPNVALRPTTSALLEGRLLEGMLGPETDLSKMKSIQITTRVNEIKEWSSDANVKEKMVKLEKEKEKLLGETKELERQLRLVQKSLQRTCERNGELEKEEELERRRLLLATPASTLSIDTKDNVLSTQLQMPALLFSEKLYGDNDVEISGNTIAQTRSIGEPDWETIIFDEPITEGVVSVALTVLVLPGVEGLSLSFVKYSDSVDNLYIGLVDTLTREIDPSDSLEGRYLNSVSFAPSTGELHAALPSITRKKKVIHVAASMKTGGRVVMEVNMDARSRTAVFIINGNVCLTFVSGLPPSIRFGFSIKQKGVSVRFDGMTRLKQATRLRRMNEIKWNPEDLRDSEDMHMNGMRSSVLCVQTQMPSLVFTDPSHFRVDDNRIACTCLATKEKGGTMKPTWSSFFLSEPISEGIVAISFTTLVKDRWEFDSFFGVFDGTSPIPEKGQRLGKIKNSVGVTFKGYQPLSTSEPEQGNTYYYKFWGTAVRLIVEIDMDSSPRTAQFFVNGEATRAVVVGLPDSVRVGFSAKYRGMQVRFDRITQLNRGIAITDVMDVVEWQTPEPLQPTESNENLGENEEKQASDVEEKEEEGKHENDATVDTGGGEDVDEDIDNLTERMVQNTRDEEGSDEDSEEDTDEEESQSENDSDNEDDGADAKQNSRQLPTMKLPELLFTHKSHFAIRNNILTRTEKGTDEKGRTRPSTVLLSEPISKGIVSVTFVVLNLADSNEQKGFVSFGLLDSSVMMPLIGLVFGQNMKHSVGFSTSNGHLHVSNQAQVEEDCCSRSVNKDRVVMEVNMDSTPRTVQFFVNGKAGKCYVSGIPESVRIGFSADVMGTSVQITSIIHCTQPTPLADKMKEMKWTDTEQSLKERNTKRYAPIRREAEGSMPALLTRNPEHFMIEGNVITRTGLDIDGLDTFSTVMLDGVFEKAIKSVTVTILALPETESSCGVVMFGGMRDSEHIPKNPKGLGLNKKHSYALCSSDGSVIQQLLTIESSKPCHSPLKVGDTVVLQLERRSPGGNCHFFVNGKAGQNYVFHFVENLMIGFSLVGPGTSIRIDAVTDLDKQSQDTDEPFSLCSLCRIL